MMIARVAFMARAQPGGKSSGAFMFVEERSVQSVSGCLDQCWTS